MTVRSAEAVLRPGTAVAVSVPGSSANLGPAFDSVGLALGLRDEYEAEVTDGGGLVVELAGQGADHLPDDERHLVHRAMTRAWQELGVAPPPGLRLVCRNTVPMDAGLGSSAAAIVAGVTLARTLAGAGDLDLAPVNDLACAMEGHPDNASASVHGGLTLSWVASAPGPAGSRDHGSDAARDGAETAVRTEVLPVHPDLEPVVLVPDLHTLATAHARSVLPEQVPIGDAMHNSARVGVLVLALTARPDLLLAGTRDWLHQEYRRESYPATMALVDELREAGHAAVVSGAGPSVLVLGTAEQNLGVDELAPAGWQVLRPGVADDGVQVSALRPSDPSHQQPDA